MQPLLAFSGLRSALLSWVDRGHFSIWPPSSLRHLSWLLGKRVLGSDSPKPLPPPLQAGRSHVSQKGGSKSWKHTDALLLSMCCVRSTCFPNRAGLLYFATLSLFLTAISVHLRFTSFVVAPAFGAIRSTGSVAGGAARAPESAVTGSRPSFITCYPCDRVSLWASASPSAERG